MKFVVLKHDHEPVHFDLMLERDSSLWTWAFYEDAFPEEIGEIKLERLPDHRKKYLSYEGPVSEDRGTVERVESGSYHLTEEEKTNLTGVFEGTFWTFPFRFTRADGKGLRGYPLWVLANLDAG